MKSRERKQEEGKIQRMKEGKKVEKKNGGRERGKEDVLRKVLEKIAERKEEWRKEENNKLKEIDSRFKSKKG